jgi:adenine-specific DNA methylase
MSQEIGQSEEGQRKTLPIEKGFPIERVNEIAEKEGRAKMYYRPIYTMHKWWARRLGCVFRAISLYTLLDDPDKVNVREPGENESLSDFGVGTEELQKLIDQVDISDPDTLWKLYSKDVQVEDKRILDPFMGGGTSLVEGSRFGVESVGYDLNPVAWFVSKKQLEGGQTDPEKLEESFNRLKDTVAGEIKQYYKTPCPNTEDDHRADVMYNFWVKELDCPSCNATVPLFRDYRIGSGRYDEKDKYNVLCPNCESIQLVDDWQEESNCGECGSTFDPSTGNAKQGDLNCPSCGQKYPIIDAIQEQNGFETRLYALEYSHCESSGETKSTYKGYKPAGEYDQDLYQTAKSEWENNEDLREYVPNHPIPLGIKTDSSQFEGNISGGHSLLRQGYSEWTDMFNHRQLLSLAKLLREIDRVDNSSHKEYLLLAVSGALRYNSMMVSYNTSYNKIGDMFRSNSFNPPLYPIENNVWGAEDGSGTFEAMWDLVKSGVEYANHPTERYIVDGETEKTEPFNTPIGENSSVYCGDAREIEDSEFDAVITDPPYYDNVIYSELSDYFYVWLRTVLKNDYSEFESKNTPRKESIVANPATQKGADEFETEMREAFSNIYDVLKEDGSLVFTYHHSDSESWGELLAALCDEGFEVTATYPITADINKLVKGESVSFDIIIVARPATDRKPISWNSLRRNIYRTAQKTRQRLEENRDLSRGDIGVVEMGRCFHEYSKHHGKVERAGEKMTAKEVVDEIYGIIQQGSDIGEIDVFLDLLETPNASYDDLNKLTRGTNATPERMEDKRLYQMDDGFKLGTWDDEKRIAYIQSRVDSDEELTDLDKAQFLRYRWEHGKSVSEYLGKWEITDDLRELCEGLADATGDDTYRNILESRLSDY